MMICVINVVNNEVVNDNKSLVYNCASFCSNGSFYMFVVVFIYVVGGTVLKMVIVNGVFLFLVYIFKLVTHYT